jgi:hypothetical protein
MRLRNSASRPHQRQPLAAVVEARPANDFKRPNTKAGRDRVRLSRKARPRKSHGVLEIRRLDVVDANFFD